MSEIKSIKVDRSKLITQAAYAKKKNVTRQRVNFMVKNNLLNTVTIEGAILILQD